MIIDYEPHAGSHDSSMPAGLDRVSEVKWLYERDLLRSMVDTYKRSPTDSWFSYAPTPTVSEGERVQGSDSGVDLGRVFVLTIVVTTVLFWLIPLGIVLVRVYL